MTLLPLVLFAGGGTFYETTTMIRNKDRAEVVATTLLQIVLLSSAPKLLRHQIEQLLRDEFADIERQAAADRADVDA